MPYSLFIRTMLITVTLILGSGSEHAAAQDDCEIRFHGVAEDIGLKFEHHSPLTPKRHLHLTMGSGVGWIDVDNDGWPDLFCCQGVAWDRPPDSGNEHDAFFLNRQGNFEIVASALDDAPSFYSTGVTVADFNNDGFADLYVAGFLDSRLYENLGDGTFRRVTSIERFGRGLYGTSCAWGDVDGDGDVDLYVATYLQIDPNDYPTCNSEYEGRVVYIQCHPRFRKATHDVLLTNEGDGRFSDSSASSGLHYATASPGLGVVLCDLDEDGDLDSYVANDTVPNHLWVNDGSGNFTEEGLLGGIALNRAGLREAGMGVTCGDYDGNGLIDIFVTNYFNETNTLYRNEGSLLFLDVTDEIGLGSPSLARLAFGTNLIDFNMDGWLDLFVANGHVNDQLDLLGRESEPFAQLPQLFCSSSGVRFLDKSDVAGKYFSRRQVGRASAIADYDRDGRPDIVVQHLNEGLAVLHNDSETHHQYLTLRLVGTTSDRSAVGAKVETRLGNQKLVRHCSGNSSYMAADEQALTIPVAAARTQKVSVNWLNGMRESWNVGTDEDENGIVTLIQGTGMAP